MTTRLSYIGEIEQRTNTLQGTIEIKMLGTLLIVQYISQYGENASTRLYFFFTCYCLIQDWPNLVG